ncbi:BglG family transcription antiterminator [Collinsella sp. zg1085]|uniref:BglG family transcription antiterminator n=1 Tax=Collinsella sp. zg1085 TaxID=2844380 RepID=UPI001C0B7D9C|nr:BglG family transcription antiterminator [Collinsella sp. zg1085]QWT17541.1 BglG family transcription antiterminator [Collinsella sp. zg1085]
MSNRLAKVFDLICIRGESISVEHIAEQMHVSTRTIYNDIQRLNAMLASKAFPVIRNHQGLLSYDHIPSLTFSSLIDTNDLIYIDQRFRRNIITQIILTRPQGFSIDELSQSMQLSRNTLIRDLARIKDELLAQGISIETISFKGYVVSGEEPAIRAALTHLFTVDAVHFEHVIPTEDVSMLDELTEILSDLADELSVTFSDTAIKRLLAALYAAYRRVRIGKFISNSPSVGLETREQELLQHYQSRIACCYGVPTIPEGELLYIAARLHESSVTHYDDLLSENWLKLTVLTHAFIDELAQVYPSAGFSEDDALFQGLLNHLRPAYWRAYHNDQVNNPMLGYVQTQCSELHETVCSSVHVLETGLKVHFDEAELAYFTLFFAASLERRNCVVKRYTRVVLVCQEGISTSQILRARLHALYNVSVVAVLGKRELKAWLAHNYADLIVSTVPLNVDMSRITKKPLPVEIVSPQLTEDDQERLRTVLDARSSDIDISELMKLITKHVSMDEHQTQSLVQELGSYFHGIPHQHYLKARYEPMLKEVLTEDLIACKVHAPDRDAAVRVAGQLLVQKGVATPEYIDAMIENVEVNGTYIVIAPGIAMPHARPEQGAQGIGFSLVTFDEPVVFGHPSNDPVRLVIALCAVDHQTHLNALAELTDLLFDSDVIARIENATQPQEVMALIEGDRPW